MRKSLCSLFLVTVISNVLWLSSAMAQDRNGSITGSVTDSAKGVLPGARVELQPKGHSVVSNGQGQFTIADLAPGRYTLIEN